MRKSKEAENRIAIATEREDLILSLHIQGKKIKDLTIKVDVTDVKEEIGMILYKDNWCLWSKEPEK